MDSGDAAVWAAAVAAMAGVGGTAVGAWFTARSLRHQVEDQARAEHRQWLRSERQRTYSEVLAGHAALQEALTQIVFALHEGRDVAPLETAAGEKARVLLDVLAATVLIGTIEVVDASDQVRSAAVALSNAASRWLAAHREDNDADSVEIRKEEYHSARASFQQARRVFAEAGRRSLL